MQLVLGFAFLSLHGMVHKFLILLLLSSAGLRHEFHVLNRLDDHPAPGPSMLAMRARNLHLHATLMHHLMKAQR